MAYIVITLNGTQIGRHELRGEAVIGRAKECEVWVNDLGVSRRHAKIELRPDGRWFVFDLKSRNGVYLRDIQVMDQILSDGDVLKIGPARIMFHEVGKYNERPSDPTDAPVEAMAPLSEEDPAEAKEPASKPTGRRLPQPKATVVKTPEQIPLDGDAPKVIETETATPRERPKPLAFTRPPAKPIIDRQNN